MIFHLAYAAGGPGIGGFHKDRKMQFFFRLSTDFRSSLFLFPLGMAECNVFCLSNALSFQNLFYRKLCGNLVHGNRGRQNTAAHIRNLRQLQEPLYRTVFSTFPMQNRKNKIRLFHAAAAVFLKKHKRLQSRIRKKHGSTLILSPASIFNLSRIFHRNPLSGLCDSQKNRTIFLSIDCL